MSDIAAIVLAAGLSLRMGASNKLLTPIGDDILVSIVVSACGVLQADRQRVGGLNIHHLWVLEHPDGVETLGDEVCDGELPLSVEGHAPADVAAFFGDDPKIQIRPRGVGHLDAQVTGLAH